jgi:hypothetical protein
VAAGGAADGRTAVAEAVDVGVVEGVPVLDAVWLPVLVSLAVPELVAVELCRLEGDGAQHSAARRVDER